MFLAEMSHLLRDKFFNIISLIDFLFLCMNKYLRYINLFVTSLFFLIPLAGFNNIININELHSTYLSFLLALAFITLCYSKEIFISKNFLYYISIFVLLIFLLLLSGLVNNKITLTVPYISYFILILLLLIYLYFFIQVSGYDFIIYLILFSSVIFSIVGLLQLSGLNFFELKSSQRPGSFLMDRTFAAEYFTVALPFAIYKFLNTQKHKFLYLFLLFIPSAYLFALRTRVAYISILFFIIILLFTYKQKLKLIFVIVVLLLSVSLSFVNFPEFEKNRDNPISSIDKYTSRRYEPNIARLFFIDTSINLFLENPFMGSGTGSWAGFFGKFHGDEFSDNTINENSAINPHNEFLLFLSENGIGGLILFILLIIIPLKYIGKSSPYFLSLIAFTFISLFSFPLENLSLMVIVSLAIAISMQQERTIKFNKIIFVLFILLSFSCTIYFIERVISEKNYIEAMQFKSVNKYQEMNDKLNSIDKYIYPVDPNKMPVVFYRGVGNFQLKNYEAAYADFSEASRLMPFFPQILNNKSISLIALNREEEAIQLLIEIKKYFPYYTESQINLLSLYMKNKNYSEAETLLAELNFKEDKHTKYAPNYNNFISLKKEFHENKY